VLDPAELNLLGRLDLGYRRAVAGLYAGERRSPHAARSPEFADFRPYVAGDDFRQIDWRAFARLERLMLRLYVAEEEATLNILLDDSESMAMGAPPKFPAARRLAAALAFLGLSAMDRVTLGTTSGAVLPAVRGREGVNRVWRFLRDAHSSGEGRPDRLAELRWLRPGMTVVISDFLLEDGRWAPALASVRARRQEPVLWQVLGPDEEHPGLAGDLRLIDVESQLDRELTITPALIHDYEMALKQHRDTLIRASQGAGGRFVSSLSSHDLEGFMVAGLRAGVVRRG